jgi:hypothetical protein
MWGLGPFIRDLARCAPRPRCARCQAPAAARAGQPGQMTVPDTAKRSLRLQRRGRGCSKFPESCTAVASFSPCARHDCAFPHVADHELEDEGTRTGCHKVSLMRPDSCFPFRIGAVLVVPPAAAYAPYNAQYSYWQHNLTQHLPAKLAGDRAMIAPSLSTVATAPGPFRFHGLPSTC